MLCKMDHIEIDDSTLSQRVSSCLRPTLAIRTNLIADGVAG